VLYHTTVADDLAANVRVFREAVERVDLMVASGGLGPTADDLTREALAQTAGVELVLDEPSLVHIRRLFAQRKREMPERNRVHAMFPAGSRAIPNPQGTAPGIELLIPRQTDPSHSCLVFALPGVPDESLVGPGMGSASANRRWSSLRQGYQP
jgi:nicotinamide-nucleotide amidase